MSGRTGEGLVTFFFIFLSSDEERCHVFVTERFELYGYSV
jgi:hypothetical protein